MLNQLRVWTSRLSLVVLSLGLLACSESPTVSNVDSSVDFSRYKTYAFVAQLSTDKRNYQTLETTYLMNAVGAEMEKRGYVQSVDDPELAINFAIETQEKIRSRPSASYGGAYDPYYDVYYDGWGYNHTTRIDQYTEGKLKIDAIDVASRKLVWQGSTKGRMTREVEQNFEQVLQEAVSEIFQQFPVPAPAAPSQ